MIDEPTIAVLIICVFIIILLLIPGGDISDV